PTEDLCSRRSQRSSAPNKHRIGNSNDRSKIATPPAKKKHGDSLKKKTDFSANDESQRSIPCHVCADVLGGTSNRSPRGLDETPQCVSTRRLISRPRKA